jgi:hypothetical protein
MALAGFSDREEIVRETSLWTLRCVNAAAFHERAATGQTDPDPGTAMLYRKIMKKESNHAPDH